MINVKKSIMSMKVNALMLAIIVGLLFGAQTAVADGEFYVVAGSRGVGTPINSLPFTITQRGFYYLTKDLTTSNNGILVDADDVTIDLMGFTINGPSITTNYGISVKLSRAYVWNLVIRNGTIRNFSKGIYGPRTANWMNLSTISNIIIRNCYDGIILNQGDISNCMVYNTERQGFGIQLWGGSIRKSHVYAANVGIDVIKGANIQENVAFDNNTGIQSKYTDPDQRGISILNNNYVDSNTTNYNVNPSSVWGVNLNH